jgi:hypothetical protein
VSRYEDGFEAGLTAARANFAGHITDIDARLKRLEVRLVSHQNTTHAHQAPAPKRAWTGSGLGIGEATAHLCDDAARNPALQEALNRNGVTFEVDRGSGGTVPLLRYLVQS